MTTTAPDLVSVGEAATLLGVSVSTLRRWEREGKLAPERTLGGHRRYRRDALNTPHPRDPK